MWRTVGTVNPHKPKHSRSRDEGSYEPFAQASRLRLNESLLSGDAQSHFMGDYFVNKRPSERSLHRVLSQKQIQTRPFVSPPTSLKDVQSPRFRPKSDLKVAMQVETCTLTKKQLSLKQASIEMQFKQVKKVERADKAERGRLQALRVELKFVKSQQNNLQNSLKGQLSAFTALFQGASQQISQRLQKLQSERQRQQKVGSINPEWLNKVRQESNKFCETMREMDSRKELIREKYRARLQHV